MFKIKRACSQWTQDERERERENSRGPEIRQPVVMASSNKPKSPKAKSSASLKLL
jgi:hypothetical protein